MSVRNQAVAAAVALANSVDWDKVDVQKIILAANQGRLGGPLTKFLDNLEVNLLTSIVDRFVINTKDGGQMKISYVGENFRRWSPLFLEEGPCDCKQFVLEADMLDKDIITKLGGVSRVITSLFDLLSKMEKQPYGPKSPAGDLLTNGRTNIWYIPQRVNKLSGRSFSYDDLDGKVVTEELQDSQFLFEINGQWYVLRAVSVYWYGGGWYVYAGSVEYLGGWGGGYQVFSRNHLEPLAPAQA